MFPPLLPLYALSLGATPMVVGALVSLLFLPSIIVAIPFGRLADLVGPKPVFLAGSTMMVAAPLILLFGNSLGSLVLFQTIAGLAQVLIVVSAQTAVAGLSEGRGRERSFGWYTTSVSIGQMLGPLAAGATADAFGFPHAFRLALVVAVISLLMATLVLPSARVRHAKRGKVPGRQKWSQILTQPGMRIAVIASTAVLGGIAGFQTFMPVHLDALAFPATTIGLLFSLVSITAVSVRPFVDRVNAVIGNTSRTLVIVIFVFAAGISIPVLGDTLPAFLAMSVLLGLGSGISQPLSMATAVEDVTSSMRGFALGLRLMANRTAQFLAPLLLGLVAERWSVDTVFPLTAVVIALFGAGLYLESTGKRRVRQTCLPVPPNKQSEEDPHAEPNR